MTHSDRLRRLASRLDTFLGLYRAALAARNPVVMQLVSAPEAAELERLRNAGLKLVADGFECHDQDRCVKLDEDIQAVLDDIAAQVRVVLGSPPPAWVTDELRAAFWPETRH